MAELTLWDLAAAEDDRRFSPYCWRVKMALRHKGLQAREIPWRFTDKPAIAFSGQGLVPVLRDGERVVHDSWDIARYLDEAYPGAPALFPAPEAKPLALFLSHWTVRTLHVPILRAVILELFAHLHEKDRTYFRESREKRFGMTLEEAGGDPKRAVADLRGALDPLRPALIQHPFLGGERPAFADYIVFGPFQWARSVSPTRLLEPDDPAYAWRERMLDLFDGYARRAKGYPVWA
jgi:glutathione S-transferase